MILTGSLLLDIGPKPDPIKNVFFFFFFENFKYLLVLEQIDLVSIYIEQVVLQSTCWFLGWIDLPLGLEFGARGKEFWQSN